MARNCNPYISVANGAVADVPANGVIPLGELVGRECCKYRLAGDGVAVRGGGESVVSGTVTMRPAAETPTAVPLSAEVRRNGQVVRGGSARIDSTNTVTLPFCVTVAGDPCNAVTVTLVNTGAAATIDGVSLVVRPA